ncbi:RIP metalloprotease RseP [Geobacter anodireducens]
MTLTKTIALTVLTLGGLIFVHELGHFLLARLNGVKVLRFSIGFGPKLFAIVRGETEYCISLVPLGGYVQMFGENGEQEPRSYAMLSPLRKISVLAAGAGFNFLFAWIAMTLALMAGLPMPTTSIGKVKDGSPALHAGLRPGDTIVAVNGQPVNSWKELYPLLDQPGMKRFTVRRGDGMGEVSVQPVPAEKGGAMAYYYGAVPVSEIASYAGRPLAAMEEGAGKTAEAAAMILMSLWEMATGKVPADSIGGPVLIAQTTAKTAEAGAATLLAFVALLGINLGVFNLLPVPVLDGGHIFFALCEILVRRPLSVRAIELANKAGMVALLALMVFAMRNDLMRLMG